MQEDIMGWCIDTEYILSVTVHNVPSCLHSDHHIVHSDIIVVGSSFQGSQPYQRPAALEMSLRNALILTNCDNAPNLLPLQHEN
jgi:hypothetical protein